MSPLRPLTLALLLIAAAVFAAAPARAETLAFPPFGFSVETPDSWRTISTAEEARIIEGADFGDDANRLVKGVDRSSRLAVLARDAFNPRVNPGIFMDLHPGNVPNIGAGLDRVLAALRSNFQGFVEVESPTEVTLGDFPAGRIRYRYDVTTADGTALTVEEVFWLIPMGPNYMTISCGVEAGLDADAVAVFERTAASLRRL